MEDGALDEEEEVEFLRFFCLFGGDCTLDSLEGERDLDFDVVREDDTEEDLDLDLDREEEEEGEAMGGIGLRFDLGASGLGASGLDWIVSAWGVAWRVAWDPA